MPGLRILGFALGCTVIALGCYAAATEDFDMELTVQNVYRIMFGILIVLAEARLTSMLRWFSFLTFFWGLGAFYIFVGGLAMGDRWYEITMAIAMCSMGFIYLIASCACAEYAHQYQADRSAQIDEETKAQEEEEREKKARTSSQSDIDVGVSSTSYNDMENGRSRGRDIDPFDRSDAPSRNNRAQGNGNGYNDAPRGSGSIRRSAYDAADDDSGNPFGNVSGRTGAY